MQKNIEEVIVTTLHMNKDIFAWVYEDLLGVPQEVIEHKLTVYPDAHPVKQLAQKILLERQAAPTEEVNKLLHTGVVFNVNYPKMISNPILVKNQTGNGTCVSIT